MTQTASEIWLPPITDVAALTGKAPFLHLSPIPSSVRVAHVLFRQVEPQPGVPPISPAPRGGTLPSGRPELPQGKTLTQSNSTLLHFDAYVHGLFLDCPALGLHVATSLQVGSSICAQGWECGCWKPTVWAQISLLPQ